MNNTIVSSIRASSNDANAPNLARKRRHRLNNTAYESFTDHGIGKSILQIVSRGSTIVMELQKLQQNIPNVYQNPTADIVKLTADFSFFADIDSLQHELDSNEELQLLDDQLSNQCSQYLYRLYAVFESVIDYIKQMNRIIDELVDGEHLGQTLESIFEHIEGQQLMCELIYQLGMMLLLSTQYRGAVRERCIVAYYRYCGGSANQAIDDICSLFRTVETDSSFPCNLYERVTINNDFIRLVIGTLCTVDLYNHLSAYSLPEHRSLALSQQAAMLVVCLFFDRDKLRNDYATMREIADRFFPNEWMVNIFPSLNLNLLHAWSPFPAARESLRNIQLAQHQQLVEKYKADVVELTSNFALLLNEGTLTKEFALVNTNKLLGTQRRGNFILRWCLLHAPEVVTFRWSDSVEAQQKYTPTHDISPEDLLELLIYVSDYELTISNLLETIINNRVSECKKQATDIIERIRELSDVFSGEKPLVRVKKNVKLQQWFDMIAKQIEDMSFDDLENKSALHIKKIQQILMRLQDVHSMHSIDSNETVLNFTFDTMKMMKSLLRLIAIDEHLLWQIHVVSDIGYIVADQLLPPMHKAIAGDSSNVRRLRAVFLKLATKLDMPLMRLEQIQSPELCAVGYFYSQQLVTFIRSVLQVVPATVFALIKEIADIQCVRIKELPTRVEHAHLIEYAALDERHDVARLVYNVSTLTEGLLAMKTTLIGLIRIEPRQVFDDGLRREIVNCVTSMVEKYMLPTAAVQKPTKKKQPVVPLTTDLGDRLKKLANEMRGLETTCSTISDYMSIDGIDMLKQECNRVMGYYTELECNDFIAHRLGESESMYQSRFVPIPRPTISSNGVRSGLGQLLDRLLQLTSIKHAIYIPELCMWMSNQDQTLLCSDDMFDSIIEGLGFNGAAGMSKILAFRLVHMIRKVLKKAADSACLRQSALTLVDIKTTIADPYATFEPKVSKSNSKEFALYIEMIEEIGLYQTLRERIHAALVRATKSNDNLVIKLLNDIDSTIIDYFTIDKYNFPQRENALLYELTAVIERLGMSSPLAKVYSQLRAPYYYAELLFYMFVLFAMNFVYDKKMHSLYLSEKSTVPAEYYLFLAGVVTLLKQQNIVVADRFSQLIDVFITSVLRYSCIAGSTNNNVHAQIRPYMSALVYLADQYDKAADRSTKRTMRTSLLASDLLL